MKTNKELNLLPCPYCHGEPYVIMFQSLAIVQCRECEMYGPRTAKAKDAIAAWNALPRRADIERVERERDWLIKRISGKLCSEYKKDCPAMDNVNDFRCMECWSKAVEEAVK